MESDTDTPILSAAKELSDQLVNAGVDTIAKFIEWSEVTDRAGLMDVIQEQVVHAERMLPTHGRTAIAVCVAYCLGFGARLGKRGLL